MNFRVRGPSGQSTLTGVDETTTISHFLALLEQKTGIHAASIEILSGFPPKRLDLPTDHFTSTVSSLSIQSGEILTVQQGSDTIRDALDTETSILPSKDNLPSTNHDAFSLPNMSEDEQLARAIAASMGHEIDPNAPPPPRQQQQRNQHTTTRRPKHDPTSPYQSLSDGRCIIRRIVPDDNSCLFSAVGYVFQGTRSTGSSLRSIVADAVLGDPIEWNEAILGKDPLEYSAWIQNPMRWGGAIELSILSKAFDAEIAAFDVQTKRAYIYGEGSGYEKRALLLYDGLHYDALALCSREGGEEDEDTTLFAVGSETMEAVMEAASKLVARFHEAKQFTDVANFQLRCGVCKIGLRGEREATQHAQQTGHTQFTEY